MLLEARRKRMTIGPEDAGAESGMVTPRSIDDFEMMRQMGLPVEVVRSG